MKIIFVLQIILDGACASASASGAFAGDDDDNDDYNADDDTTTKCKQAGINWSEILIQSLWYCTIIDCNKAKEKKLQGIKKKRKFLYQQCIDNRSMDGWMSSGTNAAIDCVVCMYVSMYTVRCVKMLQLLQFNRSLRM